MSPLSGLNDMVTRYNSDMRIWIFRVEDYENEEENSDSIGDIVNNV